MAFKLTEGYLESIMEGAELATPVLQILAIKKIVSGNANKDRYRLIVSDGRHSVSHAMLASQNNEQVLQAGEHTIVKVTRYITSLFNNSSGKEQRILLLLDVDIVASGSQVGSTLGNPTPLTEAKKNEPASSNNYTKGNSSSNTFVGMSGHSSNSSLLPHNCNNSVSLENQMIHPICSLSPYQNKWVIKARVSNKSAIRTWSNSKGEGKLFSMDLIDESGEIRCTGFKEMVDKYYDYLQVDKIYFISKCQIKAANKKFCTLKNDYEMTMTNETTIQECQGEDNGIPSTRYNFTTIDKIGNMEVDSLVDVCAICKEASELQAFQAKSSGRELKKKEVVLVDQSNCSIILTLWGTDAENFDGTNNPVVVIKGARIREFGGGKNLSFSVGGLLKINPDIPESFRIRGWYDQEGCSGNIVDISAKSSSFNATFMSFKQVKDHGLGNAEKGDYYQNVGTILLMSSNNLTYKACPTESCNKKIIDLENGMYRCEKCNREFPNFKYRLLTRMNVADWSGNTWISMFNSEGETVMGMTAQEVGEQIESNSEAAADIVEKVNFKQFLFKCRAKMETYNDEARLKTIAVEVKPINYKDFNNQIINKIKQIMG
ncbi:hypothetical protein HHI36_001044 [Cryptolaemus montrouzieri]|uniref:Replication protein A subunit n=1 Tax=Cryptolaemus montrouzieri TaxID=559131 RepID=A0ABD2P6U7_9CUCU